MLQPDYTAIRNREIAEAAKAYEVVEPGDYINIISWFGDVWALVESTYNCSEGFSASVWFWNRDRKDTTCMSRIRKVHKAGTPWDFKEARIVYTKEGTFGDRNTPPVPEEFEYKGTFKLEAWLWNYCGNNCMPKVEKDLGEFASKLGVSLTGIAWNEASDRAKLLEGVKIKGWHPICKKVAEIKYDNAIWPTGR